MCTKVTAEAHSLPGRDRGQGKRRWEKEPQDSQRQPARLQSQDSRTLWQGPAGDDGPLTDLQTLHRSRLSPNTPEVFWPLHSGPAGSHWHTSGGVPSSSFAQGPPRSVDSKSEELMLDSSTSPPCPAGAQPGGRSPDRGHRGAKPQSQLPLEAEEQPCLSVSPKVDGTQPPAACCTLPTGSIATSAKWSESELP